MANDTDNTTPAPALTAAAGYAPLAKEDCGMWKKEWLDDGTIDENLIVWDERGFTCIYIDDIRQIPVKHLDEHVKWLGRIDSHTDKV